MPITERTRKNVIQIFKSNGVKWSGKLNDVEFLSRIYDLESLPSNDSRYHDARLDISTHTVSFPGDWPSDWVFGDKRFDLHNCPDEEFLRFVCETIDPNVRPDQKEANTLLEEFNRVLAEDGVRIESAVTKFGKVKFEGKGITPTIIDGVDQLQESVVGLNWEYVNRQINRMRGSIDKDPELAIGTSKEMVESICKTILGQKGNPPKGKDELPKLIKDTLRQLGILDGHKKDDAKTQETVRKLLAALSTLVQSAAELRNLQGTGHGKVVPFLGLIHIQTPRVDQFVSDSDEDRIDFLF